DDHYAFEPLRAIKTQRPWRAARCLLQAPGWGDIYVRVMNPTGENLTLYPGRRLGTWELLTEAQVAGVRVLDTSTAGARQPAGQAGAATVMSVQEEECKEEEDKFEAKLQEEGSDLTAEQRQQLADLLREYRHIFSDQPGRTHLVEHVIDTGDERPVRGARYRKSEPEREAVREYTKKMLEEDIIQPSNSPWGASVVLVPKKTGGWRVCVDYRRLNGITKKDVFPLPRIDATLDSMGGSKFFTAMDLTSGFWQVGMDEKSREKTAFITPDGLYEYKVMPMGLVNAPATFQRLMHRVLAPLGVGYALVYLDDVMVHSKTFSDHLMHLRKVFECLSASGLRVSLKKCSFGQAKTEYLGHVISEAGVEADPKKIQAVNDFEPLKNVADVRSFLGLVGYYRRFIQGFSEIARPLNNLLHKDQRWAWTAECQTAFEQLKEKLITAPILRMPEYHLPFTVRTDASYSGLGACLLQQEEDGEQRPVAYASRSLNGAERRYTATEIEVLGVQWAIKQFRPYIYGRHFTLETDHVALKWLQTVQHNNQRLIRTALELQGYDMTIVHRAGKTMYDADALSRLPPRRPEGKEAPVAKAAAVAEEVRSEKERLIDKWEALPMTVVNQQRRGLVVKASHFPIPSGKILISIGDLAKFEGDAIVSAANTKCQPGGGVDSALSKAGGPELEAARRALPLERGTTTLRCKEGDAKITTAGALTAKWVIHAVGPDFRKWARLQLPPRQERIC
ncbi:MAG: macro domain-containing protein, partial [Flavobacteriales bacterium]|nr:macro domain-containing protein [Flavobacteriales bacterium]